MRRQYPLKKTYLNTLMTILFLLFWNSEYLAGSVLLFAVLFYLKTNEIESNQNQLELILKHFLFVIVFTFIFRKIKDIGMQYFIEINLQNIK